MKNSFWKYLLGFLPLIFVCVVVELMNSPKGNIDGLQVRLKLSEEWGKKRSDMMPDKLSDSIMRVYHTQQNELNLISENSYKFLNIPVASKNREKLLLSDIKVNIPVFIYENDTILFSEYRLAKYYQQVHFLFIPLWNYNERLVFAYDDCRYAKYSDRNFSEIKINNNIDDTIFKIPVWDRIVGKIISGLIVMFSIFVAIFEKIRNVK